MVHVCGPQTEIDEKVFLVSWGTEILEHATYLRLLGLLLVQLVQLADGNSSNCGSLELPGFLVMLLALLVATKTPGNEVSGTAGQKGSRLQRCDP